MPSNNAIWTNIAGHDAHSGMCGKSDVISPRTAAGQQLHLLALDQRGGHVLRFDYR